MSPSERNEEGVPYRRAKEGTRGRTAEEPERVVTTSEGDAAKISPGQMAQLIVDMRQGVVDREAASALARPMGELARAFSLQAELLKNVHDSQLQLGDAIKNDKKSEMMINSTDALNETFKGVRRVQQQLVSELESGRRSSVSVWTWAAAIALVIVAIAGSALWIHQRLARSQAGVEEGIGTLKREVVGDYREIVERTFAERDRLQEDKGELAEKLARARQELTQLGTERTAEARELERLRAELARVQEEGRGAVENADAMQARIKTLEAEVAEYLAKWEAARAESQRLQNEVIEKIRIYGNRWADGDGRTEPIVPELETPAAVVGADGAAAAPVEAPEVGSGEQQTGWVLDQLNTLLAKVRFNRTYRLEAVGAIGTDSLDDVVFTESISGRGVVKMVSAKNVFFTVSPQGDIVELNFRDGDVRQSKPSGGLGDPVPFYRDRYRVTIYILNGDAWLRQKLGFIRVE